METGRFCSAFVWNAWSSQWRHGQNKRLLVDSGEEYIQINWSNRNDTDTISCVQVMFSIGISFSNGILASYAAYKAFVNPTADLIRISTVQVVWAIFYAMFCTAIVFTGSSTSREVNMLAFAAISIQIIEWHFQGKSTSVLIHRVINRCDDEEIVANVSNQFQLQFKRKIRFIVSLAADELLAAISTSNASCRLRPISIRLDPLLFGNSSRWYHSDRMTMYVCIFGFIRWSGRQRLIWPFWCNSTPHPKITTRRSILIRKRIAINQYRWFCETVFNERIWAVYWSKHNVFGSPLPFITSDYLYFHLGL